MYKTRLRMNSIQKKQQVLNITHDIYQVSLPMTPPLNHGL